MSCTVLDEAALWIASGFEAAGVAAILLVSLAATARFARRVNAGSDRFAELPVYRADLGRGVLLGLELLVAADILGTVAVSPTFEHLGVLGLVVLIRTFLSVSLSVEVEGAWPWGRRTPERLPDEACNPSLSRYRERMLSSAVEGASTPPARPTRQLDASFARQTVPAPWNSACRGRIMWRRPEFRGEPPPS